jgi:hypothetical protein
MKHFWKLIFYTSQDRFTVTTRNDRQNSYTFEALTKTKKSPEENDGNGVMNFKRSLGLYFFILLQPTVIGHKLAKLSKSELHVLVGRKKPRGW